MSHRAANAAQGNPDKVVKKRNRPTFTCIILSKRQSEGLHMKQTFYVIAAGMLISTAWFAASAEEGQVMPPAGAALLLELSADGVQIYLCEGKQGGFEWAFQAPEANLFEKQGRQIGAHFVGPTWKMEDGSTIVGEVIAKADEPQPGAIPWLLLRAKEDQGSGALSKLAFIRRTDTKGGVAPKTGCDASHLSQQARMRYSAVYQFFGPP
jgi:Protein of unknown function (DUF3455)